MNYMSNIRRCLFCFRKDVFDMIQDNEEFDYFINLIIDFNDLSRKRLVTIQNWQDLID